MTIKTHGSRITICQGNNKVTFSVFCLNANANQNIGQVFVTYIFYFVYPNFRWFVSCSASFCNAVKISLRYIFFYFECLTDPGPLRIRLLSTSYRCGPTSFKTQHCEITKELEVVIFV